MILLGLRSAGPLPGQQGDREHAQRERCQREPCLERVVLEHHLEVDRERDHQPAERDLLQGLGRDSEPEVLRGEEAGVEQRRLALALALPEPPPERSERDQADRDQRADRAAAFLPDEDPQHDAAHPDGREDGADVVDSPRAGVRHVVDASAAEQHERDDQNLPAEGDAPGEIGRDEAAEERPHGSGDSRRGSDQRVGLPLHRSLEVAVDQGLHRREQERRTEAADDRPEDDDRDEALRERHRQRSGRVAEQAEDVRALAAEEVADLAADQDEGRRDECFQRDRGLHAAGGRVEVVDDRRDRHVHQRRVDHEHEHRHREQDRDQLVAARFRGSCNRRLDRHGRHSERGSTPPHRPE